MIGLIWSLIDTLRKVSRKGQDHRGKKVHSTCLKGTLTKIPFKMADSFLKSNENKNKLNKYLATKLLELHQGDQILVVTNKNTALTSQPSCPEMDQHFLVHTKLKKWINNSFDIH